MITEATMQRFTTTQPSSLRACGGYYQNTDKALDEYTPWSTGDSRNRDCDKSHASSDKLSHSFSNLAIDEMVSKILEDDSLSLSQVYNSRSQGLFDQVDEDTVWYNKNEQPDNYFSYADQYQQSSLNNVAESNAGFHEMPSCFGRKLVGRQETLGSTGSRSSESNYDQTPDSYHKLDPWHLAENLSKLDEEEDMWSYGAEKHLQDVWSKNSMNGLAVTPDNQQARMKSAWTTASQASYMSGGQMSSHDRLEYMRRHVDEDFQQPVSVVTSPLTSYQPPRNIYQQQLHQMQDRFLLETDGRYYQPGQSHKQQPVALPVQTAARIAANNVSRSQQQYHQSLSPVQQQQQFSRGVQINQLQRQALYQNHKMGVNERLYDGYMQHNQPASLPITSANTTNSVSNAAGYTFLSPSPLSDSSSLGSPLGRGADSPHSHFGMAPGSPLQFQLSPHTQSQLLQHHPSTPPTEFSSVAAMPEQFVGAYMPVIYVPREMVKLSHQTQHLQHQYQHRPPRRTGPANDLHVKLEEAYDQFKSIEKERKKTEGEMARQNPGKKVSSANTIAIPRLPSNPSRVDRLIIDSYKEHAKVVTLLVKMSSLNEKEFHQNVMSAMECWLEAISKVQVRRKEEITNATNRHRSGAPRNHDERDVIALAAAIAELSSACRKARTALWCALQASWKEGFIPLGVMSKRAEIVAREKEAQKEHQQLLAAQAMAANKQSPGGALLSTDGNNNVPERK